MKESKNHALKLFVPQCMFQLENTRWLTIFKNIVHQNNEKYDFADFVEKKCDEKNGGVGVVVYLYTGQKYRCWAPVLVPSHRNNLPIANFSFANDSSIYALQLTKLCV